MLDVLTHIGIGGVLALTLFFLIRDVLGPLVKKKQQRTEASRVTVLEINLTELSTRVEDFSKVLAEQGQAVDNKMDIVLQELKEIRGEFAEAYRNMTERIARAETHIEHLFKGRTRGAN